MRGIFLGIPCHERSCSENKAVGLIGELSVKSIDLTLRSFIYYKNEIKDKHEIMDYRGVSKYVGIY